MPGITGPLIDEAYDLEGLYNADYVLGLGYTTDFTLEVAPPVIIILLPPRILFETAERPAALVSTLDLLIWGGEERVAALVSDARPLTFATDERPAALASTVDILTWNTSERPTALVSVARDAEEL